MSFRNILIAACAALLSLSCVDNDRSMGEDLISKDYRIKVKTRTFDVPVTNKVSDSVQASNTMQMIIGYMNDPVYGKVTASGASFILPFSDSTDYGDSPKLINAYLSLSIDTAVFFKENQEGIHQNLSVYKMTKEIDSLNGFCNSISPDDYDPDPVSQGSPVIYRSGKISINLKDSFAEELLSITPEEFEDDKKFTKKIKGLYLKTEDPLDLQYGGRFNQIYLGSSTIYLNYIMNDPDRGIKDLDTTESFVFGYNKAVNNFATGSRSLENDDPQDRLYIESLTGIKPHIDADTLKKILDRWILEEDLTEKTIILSRATLIFPYEMPNDYENFNREHPKEIYAFRNNPHAKDTTRYYKPLKEVYNVGAKGMINRSLEKYELDITSFCQKLINTPEEQIDDTFDLWIAPMSHINGDYGEVTYEINNMEYKRVMLNGPASERRPTLTLTYSTIE